MKKELNKKFFSNFRVWWRYCLTLFCMLLTIIPLTTSSAFRARKDYKSNFLEIGERNRAAGIGGD